MSKFVYTVIGLLFGIIAGGSIASRVYVPQLKCDTQIVAKVEKNKQYPKGTFEHEVKRTE